MADSQGLTLPGVTVSASSSNLQGVRTIVTSTNGDYMFTALPPGTYALTFEFSGFQTQTRTASVAPTHVLQLDATMGVATVAEMVNVIGRAGDVVTRTARVATNFSQGLIATLPTARDMNSTLLMAPAVHPTRPIGAYSTSGSMSFDTLYMINGVDVSENLRGHP